MKLHLFPPALVVVTCALCFDARAASFVIGARTEAQAYGLRSWRERAAGDPAVLPRHRIVQYLELGAFELGSVGSTDRLDFVASLRLDQDFGLSSLERDTIDGLQSPAFHLLYGYLRWQGGLHGVLDAQLGRQVVFDPVQFFSYDGLELTVHTPVRLGVSLFGGYQVQGTSLFGSPTFAPDGVRGSDRRRIDAGASTDPLGNPAADLAHDSLDVPSPIFGARLSLERVRSLFAFVAYRRAMSETQGTNLVALPEEAKGYQLDSEHLAAAARWQALDRLAVHAAVDRDLVRGRLSLVRGGTDVELVPYRLTLRAEAARYHPSFDADSIWNLFATGPRDEYEASLHFAPPGALRYHAGPLLTLYHLALDPRRRFTSPDGAIDPERSDLLPGFTAGLATKANLRWRLALDLLARGKGGTPGTIANLGRELWLDALLGRSFGAAAHRIDFRVSVAQVSDPSNVELQRLWSAGFALLSSLQLSDISSLLLIAEQNVNRFTDDDLRAYAVFELRTEL